MSDYFVIAEYDTSEQAAIGLEVLEKSDFVKEEVSLISVASGNDSLDRVKVPDEAKSWKEKAADYKARLKAGSVLIVVNVDSRVRLDDAANPLKTTGPVSLERFEPTE